MKSVLSIFLICYFSFAAIVPRMDFDRLATIPNLVGHFIDHDKGDSNLSVIEFINVHYYGDKSEKPSDGHELPFQEHDCSLSGYLYASFLSDLTGSLLAGFPPATFLDSYSFHFTSKHTSDIWQPPRA